MAWPSCGRTRCSTSASRARRSSSRCRSWSGRRRTSPTSPTRARRCRGSSARTLRRSWSRRRGGRCRTRWCCRSRPARRSEAAAPRSRRWRDSRCCARPSSPASRRSRCAMISNSPGEADRGTVAFRGCVRPARRDRPAAARGAGRSAYADLRLLAVPERHLRFPRARARARRRAVQVEPVLLDIEELNRRAHTGELELTKLSFGAFGGVGEALPAAAERRSARSRRRAARRRPRAATAGRGRRDRDPRSRDDGLSATCGSPSPALGEVVELRYDEILGAVEAGEVDAGLIIHESRFTYADHGLVAVADSASGGRARRGCPFRSPGSVLARTRRRRDEIEAAIRASVEYAFAHPEASRHYVRAHAQELSDEVCDRAHRALREREQRRHRRRGLGRRSNGCRPQAASTAAWLGQSSSPPFVRRRPLRRRARRACGPTTSRRCDREAVERAGVPPARSRRRSAAANQAGEDNRNVARMAALLAGLPDRSPGVTVNRLCASGLAAVVGACHAASPATATCSSPAASSR